VKHLQPLQPYLGLCVKHLQPLQPYLRLPVKHLQALQGTFWNAAAQFHPIHLQLFINLQHAMSLLAQLYSRLESFRSEGVLKVGGATHLGHCSAK
jgi:hypothetical protein